MDIGVYDGLESMSNLIKRSPKNLEKINKLKTYLDQLDVRRNTNWRTTFPWLDNDFT